MSKKVAKTLGVLLLLTAIAVTQVPVSDVEAIAPPSDFEMDGTTLLRYGGTAEAVSIPSGIKTIAEEAFVGNDNLLRVDIGEDVESIGYRAFAGCDNLRTVVIGNSVESIGMAAFSNDKALKNFTIGRNVKSIGNGVFAGSGQLENLTLSEDNPYLYYSDGVLYDDEMTKIYALMPAYEKGALTIPGTVREVSGYAFWGNPYLERVVVGSGLTHIPAYAFSNCMNLREVELPLPVHTIEAKAFEDCVNLRSINLPESMNNIHDTAFDGCPNVEFHAVAGTYGDRYAQARKLSEVEELEYEDVQDAQTVDPESISAGDPGNNSAANPEIDETDRENGQGISGSEPVPTSTPVMLQAITETVNNKTLLGQSSIVSGRAVIFIDNRQPTVLSGSKQVERIDLSTLESNMAQGESGSGDLRQTEETISNVLVDNAQKGKDFPKYTIVNDSRIASQAFYQDKGMTEYQIEDGIREIGEFAFARSGLTSVVIPDGVTRIECGAFYHCDSLNEVVIPNSVQEIEAYAFDKTPWLESAMAEAYPFLVVGDGILLAYAGSDSVVNIPQGVKQIGAGAFKEHMGITAVNLPDSVEVIDEEAFMNCRNLKTVNGGERLKEIRDRAFMNCPLSKVVISATVERVGLGAYALSGGTDTVVFEGTELPVLSVGKNAKRLANKNYRTYAFNNIREAIVPDYADLSGTVLEAGGYGYHGTVVNESGGMVADLRNGVSTTQEAGILLRINSNTLAEGKNSAADIPGDEESYILTITDSPQAADAISAAYGELYGGRTPTGLSAYEISLYDASGNVPINRLGKQYVNVRIPMPAAMTAEAENLHVVTLDQDGQLEAVEHRIVELEDGNYIQFTTNHFSPFGIYRYSSFGGQAVVKGGSAVFTSLNQRDDTPDTGDLLHPKWFLAAGLLAGAVALFFYKGKAVNKRK